MFTVMRDPVRLPSSKTILDRATIKSHLLSDSKDPFNRAPLSIEDVVPGEFSPIIEDCSSLIFRFFLKSRSPGIEAPYRSVLNREAKKVNGCRCTIRFGDGHLELNHYSLFDLQQTLGYCRCSSLYHRHLSCKT